MLNGMYSSESISPVFQKAGLMEVRIEHTLSNTKLSGKFFSKHLFSSPSALGRTGDAALPINYATIQLKHEHLKK